MLAKKVAKILFSPVPATLAVHLDFHSHEQFALPLNALVGRRLSALHDDGLTV